MGLVFLNNYVELNDKELVNKIINKPYNEEAAAYLIYNRYDPLLHKLYREIYDKDPSWYEDCLGDLFEFLKGKEGDWNKLRAIEWRSNFGPWLSRTAKHRFLEIKPYLIGKIENSALKISFLSLNIAKIAKNKGKKILIKTKITII